MRSWLILLSGLILWAAHFFALYTIGEFAGDGMWARVAVLALTVAGLFACAVLIVTTRRLSQGERFDSWRRTLALSGLSLGAIAMLWQSLPALF